MTADKQAPKEHMKYKGKLLIRRKDEIMFGNFDDKYVIRMRVKDRKKIEGLMLSSQVGIELRENQRGGRVVKKAERDGMYRALDLAEYWLNEAISGNLK